MALILEGKGNLTQATATRAFTLLSAIPSLRCTTRDACGAVREEPLTVLREVGRLPVVLSDEDAFKPIAERLWPEPPHQQTGQRDCRDMQGPVIIYKVGRGS